MVESEYSLFSSRDIPQDVQTAFKEHAITRRAESVYPDRLLVVKKLGGSDPKVDREYYSYSPSEDNAFTPITILSVPLSSEFQLFKLTQFGEEHSVLRNLKSLTVMKDGKSRYSLMTSKYSLTVRFDRDGMTQHFSLADWTNEEGGILFGSNDTEFAIRKEGFSVGDMLRVRGEREQRNNGYKVRYLKDDILQAQVELPTQIDTARIKDLVDPDTLRTPLDADVALDNQWKKADITTLLGVRHTDHGRKDRYSRLLVDNG